jgi:hypothetical protein
MAGAATGPLAGARAAVERIRGGAYGPVPHADGPSKVRRRSGENVTRPVCPLGARQGHAGDCGGGEVGPGRYHFPTPAFATSDLGLGFRDKTFAFSVSIGFEIDSVFLSFPKQDLLPSMILIPLIESPNRLGVDRVGKLCKSHTFTSTVASFAASSVKICTRAATVGVEVECGDAGGASRRFSTFL